MYQMKQPAILKSRGEILLSKIIDLTGQRFGKLTVYCRAPNKGSDASWECICDCGETKIINGKSLRSGVTRSCGCIQKETVIHKNQKYNGVNTENNRIYSIYTGMRQRCNNNKNKRYTHYGGRGITICEEWTNDFKAFEEWALNNGYSDGLSIDRIDVNKGYSPENCRWTVPIVQMNNTTRNRKLEFNGEIKTLSQWSSTTGIGRKTISSRIDKLGWSIEDALTQPVHHYK